MYDKLKKGYNEENEIYTEFQNSRGILDIFLYHKIKTIDRKIKRERNLEKKVKIKNE